MARTKIKFDTNYALDRRLRDCFDFLRVHENELTEAQRELIKSFRKQHYQRGLSDKQVQVLFDIAKYLEPEKIINVKYNY